MRYSNRLITSDCTTNVVQEGSIEHSRGTTGSRICNVKFFYSSHKPSSEKYKMHDYFYVRRLSNGARTAQRANGIDR